MSTEKHSASVPTQNPKGVWCMGIIALALLGAGAYWLIEGRSQFFIWKWTNQLQSLGSLAAIQKYNEAHTPEPFYLMRFPSSEWVAIASEHACSGAGFNATIFYDSSGAAYLDTTHHFCGVEGLGEELHRVDADSLAGFYPKLTQLKLQRR